MGARAARENSVNFGRRGEYGSAMNAALLYLNAGIQGSRLLIRNLKNRPKETISKISTTLLLPISIFTYLNLKDPERKAAYEDHQDYEKENNIIIIPPNPIKNSETGKWNSIKIPLPPGLGQFANIPRRMIEASYDLDPVEFNTVATDLLTVVSPIDPEKPLAGALPTAVKGFAQAGANYNYFTERPIVPQNLQDLPPEDQYRDNTSGTARKIGETFGVSPLKVEQFTKDHLGGVAPQLLNASDRALSAAGVIPDDQVGGYGPLDAIGRRFYGAAGGAVSADEIAEMKKRDQESEKNKKEREEEAEKIHEELKSLPKEEANTILDEIKVEDPLLRKEIGDLITFDKEGIELSPDEKYLRQLNVYDGTRAKYIFDKSEEIREKDGKEAANAYLKDLERKKIISSDVKKQIRSLIKKSNSV